MKLFVSQFVCLVVLQLFANVVFAFSASPNPSTGTYSVSWSSIAGTNDGYRLYESTNGGVTWGPAINAYGTSKTFTDKPAGTYHYRLKSCNIDFSSPEPLPQCFNSPWGTTSVVVHDPSIPDPEPLDIQLGYEYEVRSGDFDHDGHTDLFVERLTA